MKTPLFCTLLLFIIVIMFFPFVQTEVLTYTKRDELAQLASLCQSPVKYVKVSSYEEYRGKAVVLCVHENSEGSEVVTLNRLNDQWIMIKTEKMFDDGIKWPWYV
jgi:hypothetical protein